MEYENPILSGFYPDPSVCRVGKDFYMVNSTFEYLPGIPVFHSRDLVNWEQIGHCITRPSQMTFPGTKASKGLYAPTIRYHAGTFYMVCTNTSIGEAGNFVVTSDNPRGPWSDPVWFSQTGIDPSLLFDDDGSVYLTSNGWGETTGRRGNVGYIQQSRVDIRTGAVTEGPRVISLGTGGRCVEGPHLYKINDWYYLLLAEGGTETGHMITVFRSRSPWGPFEPGPDNPVLTARDEARPVLTGTGHGDLFEDDYGNWWIVFLCYRISTVKYHHLGRETALLPVIWENGWPKAAGGKCAKVHVAAVVNGRDSVRQAAREGEYFLDDFSGKSLNLKWNFIREFFDGYESGDEKEGLILHGRPENLSDGACPAFIGRRQCHMMMECSVDLSFHPAHEWEEAGIAVLCSDHAHYDLGIRERGDRRYVLLHRRVEDMESVTERALPADKMVTLYIEADREQYTFGFVSRGEKHVVGTGMVKLLSTEVIWGFTGVYVGVYATGNGRACDTPAGIRRFSYQGT